MSTRWSQGDTGCASNKQVKSCKARGLHCGPEQTCKNGIRGQSPGTLVVERPWSLLVKRSWINSHILGTEYTALNRCQKANYGRYEGLSSLMSIS